VGDIGGDSSLNLLRRKRRELDMRPAREQLIPDEYTSFEEYDDGRIRINGPKHYNNKY